MNSVTWLFKYRTTLSDLTTFVTNISNLKMLKITSIDLLIAYPGVEH